MKIKLILDIMKTQQAQLNAIVTGRQGDKNSITVNVFVVDGGVPFNLTGNSIFYEGLKPNNHYVRDTEGVKIINATQGNFEYTFRPETFGVAGVGKRSYFSIEQGGTVRASTQDFGLVTIPDAATGSALSGPYISELEELKRQAQALVDDINDRWVSVNDQLASLQIAVDTLDVVRRQGDTMTGSLKMKVPLAGSVGYGFVDTNGLDTSRVISIANGNVVWQDRKNLIDVFTYTPANKTFTMQAETNLLKKTGDNMSGSLTMNSNINMNFPAATKARSIRWQQDNADYISMGTNNAGEFVVYDQANAKSIFVYYPTTNTFNLNAGITNLVKSTGDTITGLITTTDNIRFKAGGERNITWRDGNDTEYIKLYANSGGNRLGLWSTKNNKAVWEYHGDNDIFNVTVNTNLLKKTGDTMTGNLLIDRGSTGEKYFGFMSGNGSTLSTRWVDDPNNTFWVDATNNQIYMQYRKADKMFLVNSDTNLLKKTGDTVTGGIIFKNTVDQQTSDGTSGIVSVINQSLTKWAVAPRNDGTVDWSKELAMDLKTGKVTVASLATKNDGRANLTLTADAIDNSNGSYIPVAIRRGNTVTLRMDVTRKVGSTGTVVTSLPSSMKPTDSLAGYATASDGTSVSYLVKWDGSVEIHSENKKVRLLVTYVVD
ncbi:hypothetical protein COJ45_06905 [Bacillus cereus]|nr:hypothetical protein COJ45_06905 [Bacillus cereus]